MLYNSFEFIFAFLPLLIIACFFVRKKNEPLKLFIILGSLFFYAYWSIQFLPLLLGSIVCNYFLASKVKNNRNWLKLSIVFNLALLGIFKYLGFVTQVLADIGTNTPLINLTLPLAISFFTFQQVAYLIDVHKNRIEPGKFCDYLFFISFFPQLIAGPIVNFKTIRPQLPKLELLENRNSLIALQFFTLGLFKKSVLADSLAPSATSIFDGQVNLDFFSAWIGTLSYTFQLYFDFSGYSDMAVGLALIFGIKIPFNFNSPYKSSSIQTFWRNWHMTLSAWFKEYVYIPLGGSKKGVNSTAFNLFIVAMLSGIWHGANYTFFIWGFLHALALIIHRYWSHFKVFRLPRAVSVCLTLLFVHLAWVIFRAPDISTALSVYQSLFSYAPRTLNLLEIYKLIILGSILLSCLFLTNSNTLCNKIYPKWVSVFTGLILFLSIGFLNRVSEFLYFQF